MIDRELYRRIMADYALVRFSVFMEKQERSNAIGIFEGWIDEEKKIARINMNMEIRL